MGNTVFVVEVFPYYIRILRLSELTIYVDECTLFTILTVNELDTFIDYQTLQVVLNV